MFAENSPVIRCAHLQPGDRVSVIELDTDGARLTATSSARGRDILRTLEDAGLRPQLGVGSRSDKNSPVAEAIEWAFLDPEIRAIFVLGDSLACASNRLALNYAALAAHPTVLVTELSASPIAMAVHLHTNIVTFCWLPPETPPGRSVNGNGSARPNPLDLLMRPLAVGRLKPSRVLDKEGKSRQQAWRWHNSRIGEGRLLVGGLESISLLSPENANRGEANYLFLDPGPSRFDSESGGSSVIRPIALDVLRSLRGMVLADRIGEDDGESGEAEEAFGALRRSLSEGYFPVASGASIRNGPGGSILPIGARAQMNGATRRFSIVEPGVV